MITSQSMLETVNALKSIHWDSFMFVLLNQKVLMLGVFSVSVIHSKDLVMQVVVVVQSN